MLEQKLLGETLENWGISFLILLGTIVVIKLASIIYRKLVTPIVKKTKNKLDDVIFEALESPLKFAIALIGMWIAIHNIAFSANYSTKIDDAYKVLIILNITWFFARLCSNLISIYWASADGAGRNNRMSPIINRTILVIIWIVGFFTALININIDISALLGTLGIGGIAFALAAQDTIKNIFGAFTILTDKPFSIGDTVRVDGHEGTIIDIGIRSTKMRNHDKRIITFPNYKMADTSVMNISAEPMRRIVMKLGLTYNTTPEQMTQALTILKGVPSKVKYVSSSDLTADFTDFADSALVITFIYYIEKRGTVSTVRSNVNMEILKAFSEAGLEFAFPTQTIHIETSK